MQTDYKRGKCLAIALFFYFLVVLFARGSIRQGLESERFSDESRGT